MNIAMPLRLIAYIRQQRTYAVARHLVGFLGVAVVAYCMSSAYGALSVNLQETGTVSSDDARWAFRPLDAVAVPRVTDDSWCRTPVDRFILAKLESRGI